MSLKTFNFYDFLLVFFLKIVEQKKQMQCKLRTYRDLDIIQDLKLHNSIDIFDYFKKKKGTKKRINYIYNTQF